MSKGSRARPFSVSQAEFDNNMDRIFGKKELRAQWVPPPLPIQEPTQTQEIRFDSSTTPRKSAE